MMTKDQLAKAFVARKAGKCHNASTGGDVYTLHQSPIAVHEKGAVVFYWHGFYTPTTASHMNAILKALGASFRVSYSTARVTGATTFVWEV
jgi:hypothetical protein